MRINLLRLALLAGLLAVSLRGTATHYMGAEITYQHLSGSVYRVYHKAYYDCSGAATTPLPGPAPSPWVTFTPVGIGTPPQPTMLTPWILFHYIEISPTCPSIPTRCTNMSSPINGVLEAVYYCDYDFALCPPGSSFRIEWTDCCRNSTITSGANDESIYVSTTLRIDSTDINSSPTFQYPPVVYVNSGQPYIISQGAFDAEGDSLVYSLGPCLQSFTQTVTYLSGYSPTTPLGTSWNCSIHPQTGEISLIPSPTGNVLTAVLGIVVDEYRNGVKIGTVNRDMQVTVLPNIGGLNNPPMVSGIQNLNGAIATSSNVLLASIPSGVVSFDLTVTDADTAQVLGFMTSPLAALYGTTITQVGTSTNPLTVHISRVLPANQTGQFTIGLNFFDDFCPIKAFTTASYVVYIDSALLHPYADSITSSLCDSSLGAIDVAVLGANPPYNFLWSTGDTTEDISGLTPGFYSLTTTDASGQVSLDTFLVPAANLAVTLTDNWVNCLPAGGELAVQATGATAPYTFLWNTGDTTASISGLAPGGYHVYVTDSAGCINEGVAILAKPDSCDAIIGGKVYLEFNVDCNLDVFEYPVPFTYINFTPGGGVFTDVQGNYEYRGDTGLVVIKAYPPAPMIPSPCSMGDSLIKHPTALGYDTTGNDFPLYITSITATPLDLSITEWSSPGRPGFDRSVVITAANLGWVSSTPTVTWTHDPLFTFLGAVPPPTSYDPLTHTATWSGLPALGAFQSQYFFANLHLDSTVATGLWFCDTATVAGSPADTVLANNVYVRCDTTRAAFDPNIKAVTPKGATAEGFIPSSDSVLTYTLQFQNTGTDTAFYVTVRDTLDTDLDLPRFRPIASSAPYKLLVEDENILVFQFDHINLPDSGTNMAGSIGFVTFTLPLKTTVQGTVVDNRAGIYFDFNAPVMTNSVRNTICNPTKAAFSAVRGSNGRWIITPAMEYAEQWFWNMGELGSSTAVTPEPFMLPDTGFFPVTLITQNACGSDTFEMVLHEVWAVGMDASNMLGMSILPNPAQDMARIRITAAVPTVTITDVAGRTLRTLPVTNGEATFVRGDLPAGMYYVRAVAADGRVAGMMMIVE